MKPLIRITCSVLCAGIVHVAWLAAFISTAGWDNPILFALRWLSAPIITAAGFAAGAIIGERVTGVPGTGFWRTLLWPLAGCALGAGVVYWFGPMLIGFAMFVVGTLSVIVREVIYHAHGKSPAVTP